MPRPTLPVVALLLLSPLALTPSASAQSRTFQLGGEGEWVETDAPEPGSDRAMLAEMRRLIATGRASRARSQLQQFVDDRLGTQDPLLPEALLALADAKVADGAEYKALFDYEFLIRSFPSSPEYVTAIQRELEIAQRYAGGLRRTMFGLRLLNAGPVAEELFVRAAERLPRSEVAEEALIGLGDFYYRDREMRLAADVYDIFLRKFPVSRHRERAMVRRILANVALYKGPRYNPQPIEQALTLVQEFQARYPLEAEQIGITESLEIRIDESAGSHMLESAQWYLKRGDGPGARLVLRRLLDRHPRTTAASTARQILEERGWSRQQDAAPPAVDLPLGPALPTGDEAAEDQP